MNVQLGDLRPYDLHDQIIGRFEHPIPGLGIPPAGFARVAVFFGSLFAAMFIIAHSHSLFGPILGMAVPTAAIAVLQLSRR